MCDDEVEMEELKGCLLLYGIFWPKVTSKIAWGMM